MKERKPVLQILADRSGIYEVAALSFIPGNEGLRLQEAIQPAVLIIDKAIRAIYGPDQQSATHACAR